MTTTTKYPIVFCEPTQQGDWRFYCEHCRRWHYHGALPGHRAAHCIKPDSPYRATGYVLVERQPEMEKKRS